MTTSYVSNCVGEIRSLKDDDETAHIKEDELWENVLLAIADGAADAAELAREALKTRTIKFARWCA